MTPPDVQTSQVTPVSSTFEGISALARANPWQTQEISQYLNRFNVAPANLEYLSQAEQVLMKHNYALTFTAQELFEKAAAIHRESVEVQRGGEAEIADEKARPWYEQPWLAKRWEVYGIAWPTPRVDASGKAVFSNESLASFAVAADGSVRVHSIRQASITAAAALTDTFGAIDNKMEPQLGLSPEEVDILAAVAFIHDLGEFAVGDLTYEKKEMAGEAFELIEARAALKLLVQAGSKIDQENWQKHGPILAEAYLRITTKLNDQQVSQLMQEFMEQAFSEATNVSLGKPQGSKESPRLSYDWDKLRDRFKLYERIGYMVTALNLLDEIRMHGVEELPEELKQIMPHLTLDVFEKLDAYAVLRLEEVQDTSTSRSLDASQETSRLRGGKARVEAIVAGLRRRIRQRSVEVEGDKSCLQALMDSYLDVNVDEMKQRIYLLRAMALIRNVFDHQLEALGAAMAQQIPSVNAFLGNGEFIDRVAWFNSQFKPVPNPSYLEKLRTAWGAE